MTITILQDDQEHDRQMVQLSLSVSSYGPETTLTIAHLGKDYLNLARLRETLERDEDGKLIEPEKIALSAEEADALVEAWTAFKNSIAAREQAEAERREKLKQEAFRLVESVKTELKALDIQITEDASHRWFTVEVQASDFYEIAYQIEELLPTVERAIARTDKRIAALESETEDYQHRYYSEEGRAVRATQIAAWRKVRPVGGDDGTPQGSKQKDFDPLTDDNEALIF